MRYALFFRWGELWSENDIIIIDEERSSDECGGERWFDTEEKVARLLIDYGLDSEQVLEVMNNHWWYVHNCDDIDYYVNEKGDII